VKTKIYKVTIYRHDRYHAAYRFIGRAPTKEEMLSAIERRLDGSLVSSNRIDAHYSAKIISEIGVPTKLGPLTGATWEVIGVELGKVTIERENAWTLQ
jgi:hypothetical protein